MNMVISSHAINTRFVTDVKYVDLSKEYYNYLTKLVSRAFFHLQLPFHIFSSC